MKHDINPRWLERHWWCPLCWMVRIAERIDRQLDRLLDWADGKGGDDDCGGCK